MKANQTSMVAFVAPWCGHCQKLAPEYSKAALGLYPLIPVYAVDCDDDKNKRLCAEQDVKGFPTVKLFPRGKTLPPIVYDRPERSGSAFFYFASRRIPKAITKLYQKEEIDPWVTKSANSEIPRALLLRKERKDPMLWSVLGNKYKDQMELAIHHDRKGKTSVFMGMEAGDPKVSKILIYPVGSTQPVLYEGIQKLDSLSKFFDSILDGTADLKVVNQEAAQEEFVPDETDLEIERKQEAQRIALAHGGFSDLIDFEAAIKKGAGANYHDSHGYPGMMGGVPPAKKKTVDADEATEPPVTPTVTETKAAEPPITPTLTETESESTSHDQVVFDASTETPSPSSVVGECSASGVSEAAGECKPPTSEHPKDEL